MKDQINFKSDLGKIKKGNPNSKSEDQISVVQNVEHFFDLGEKNIDYIRDFFFLLFFCYLKLNVKQNTEKDSNINS